MQRVLCLMSVFVVAVPAWGCGFSSVPGAVNTGAQFNSAADAGMDNSAGGGLGANTGATATAPAQTTPTGNNTGSLNSGPLGSGSMDAGSAANATDLTAGPTPLQQACSTQAVGAPCTVTGFDNATITGTCVSFPDDGLVCIPSGTTTAVSVSSTVAATLDGGVGDAGVAKKVKGKKDGGVATDAGTAVITDSGTKAGGTAAVAEVMTAMQKACTGDAVGDPCAVKITANGKSVILKGKCVKPAAGAPLQCKTP